MDIVRQLAYPLLVIAMRLDFRKYVATLNADPKVIEENARRLGKGPGDEALTAAGERNSAHS